MIAYRCGDAFCRQIYSRNWTKYNNILFYLSIKQVPYLLVNGFSEEKCTTLLVLLAVSQTFGKLSIAIIGDHLPFAKIYLLSVVIFSVAILTVVLRFVDSFQAICAILFGMSAW